MAHVQDFSSVVGKQGALHQTRSIPTSRQDVMSTHITQGPHAPQSSSPPRISEDRVQDSKSVLIGISQAINCKPTVNQPFQLMTVIRAHFWTSTLPLGQTNQLAIYSPRRCSCRLYLCASEQTSSLNLQHAPDPGRHTKKKERAQKMFPSRLVLPPSLYIILNTLFTKVRVSFQFASAMPQVNKSVPSDSLSSNHKEPTPAK